MSEHANCSHRMLLVINATNTAGMEGATSSLAVSCEDSSMIGTVTAASEQMSAQSYLPSSLRAALNFVAGHPTLGPQEQIPTSVQGCFPYPLRAALNFGCTGAKENPIVIEDEQDEEKSSNYVEKHNNYVYKRRKLQGNSVTLLPKQIQTDAGKDCLPNDMLNSDWSSRLAQVENFPECREDINFCDASMSTCHRGYSGKFSSSGKKLINGNSNRILDGEMYNTSARMHVDCKAPDSEEISLYHTGSSGLIVDGGKMNLNIVEVGEASSGSRSVIEDSTSLQVQSSSSFEMSDCNLGQTTVSVKHELTELAECTSTVDVIQRSQENDLEKEWCVSVLKQCGLLGQFVSSRDYAVVGHPGVVGDGSCPQLCKICSSLEDSTSLICDLCDEAFHMSCCNPKVKSAPTQDDWYCQFCRKKRKTPGKKSLTESRSARNAVKATCTNFDKSTQDKGDLFSCMLENSEPYTTQVRIGKAFQADVPDWIGNVPKAPLSQVQNDEWDCSCAVVWDPVHADCAVPQELKTEDIMMRLKATEMAKPQLVYKKRKSKMKHCIAEDGQTRIEGPTPL